LLASCLHLYVLVVLHTRASLLKLPFYLLASSASPTISFPLIPTTILQASQLLGWSVPLIEYEELKKKKKKKKEKRKRILSLFSAPSFNCLADR
jgi:hypothetical protein